MRSRALTVGAFLLFVACVQEGPVSSFKIVCGPAHPCNLHVIAPLQLDQATIAVDGTQTGWLMQNTLEHPLRSLLLRFIGSEPKPRAATGTCHVPAGTHIVRIVKPGWEPIERVVVVDKSSSHNIALTICPADLRSRP